MNPAYPTLLSPFTITHADGSQVTLPCRVMMGSMHTGLEEQPGGMARLAAFYGERAAGGVALIVTGGLSPNAEGNMFPGMRTISDAADAEPHRAITDAVHAHGSLVALQLLHAGRYARHGQGVAPSALKSPLSSETPRAMTEADIQRTLDDYARAARLARDAGYDGVEVMGAEGYLINQFAAPRANQRTDEWGGSASHRMRFAVEAVRRVREATGPRFILIYRLSMLDLVEGGCTWDEVAMLARAIQDAGASIINPYVGWHEARIPTIATLVPRAAFVELTARLKQLLRIPVVASNRINTPEDAEQILARGDADLVSMARPLLADAAFVAKARRGHGDDINTCIACNQGCLDAAFSGRITGCLVNPRACRETELVIRPAGGRRRIAVVGAGPGGMAAAATAAERGHEVTLFDTAPRIGGQFNLARRIPGKEEYAQTLRHFESRLRHTGVQTRLNTTATADDLSAPRFDHVILATGIRPRKPAIPGIDLPGVLDYTGLIEGRFTAGPRVAVIGAGGIGFDVTEMLTHEDLGTRDERHHFAATWGIDFTVTERGGLTQPHAPRPPRQVWLLQRKDEALGKRLGKTTGWIRRALLGRRGVQMWAGIEYERIERNEDRQELRLHLRVRGEPRELAVDSIVICAGQESEDRLLATLQAAGQAVTAIGGARLASELDAARAIDEGTRLAASL
ncbi:FAD-dependent oxidoreductase [Hydrogenophaga sp. ZJX-1]|uniref:oxidoreductase n=1 Tax=Hydrogenophaga sp. ZJX-1 TaxID=3404778 RepID=UPI003B285731